MTRRSANSPTEQELEDWLEMLIRYMRRHHEQGYGDLLWDIFKDDYPHTARELDAARGGAVSNFLFGLLVGLGIGALAMGLLIIKADSDMAGRR
jgi:hypothetical protein